MSRGVNGQLPYGNPTNTQVTATLTEKHAPYKLTGFNIFASQGDQRAIMRKASMNAINREIDLTILAELASATNNTGAAEGRIPGAGGKGPGPSRQPGRPIGSGQVPMRLSLEMLQPQSC